MYSKILVSIPIFLASCLIGAEAGKDNTKSICLTLNGPSSVRNVPTSRTTSTEILRPLTITRTVYTIIKATPEPKVITIVRVERATTTTTLRTITGAFTTTVTATATSTSTDVVFSTDVSTIEQTTTTTTGTLIPTPNGFRYLSDTAELRPPIKRDESRRGAVIPLALRAPQKAEGCIVTEKQYPQKVDCKYIEKSRATSTTTVTKAITINAPRSRVRTTSTTTKTRTSTVCLARITETSTVTTTETLVENTQSTSVVPSTLTNIVTATVTQSGYAACATQNMLSSYNGQAFVNAYNNPVGGGQYGGGSIYQNAAAADATECCSVCQGAASTTQGCQGYLYLSGRCVILYSNVDTCSASQVAGKVTYAGTANGFTVGNGPCGYLYASTS